jgi:hypothetical protein
MGKISKSVLGVKVGDVFNFWTVIGEPYRKRFSCGKYFYYAVAKCKCGREVDRCLSSLVRGQSKSCGCFVGGKRKTNGIGRTKLCGVWRGMRNRCHNSKDPGWGYYGGRGIRVCRKWREDFSAFESWALANGYREDLQIDRIDNDRGYSPGNCRFVTRAENVRNTRRNRFITAWGQRKTVSEWSVDPRCVISRKGIVKRLDTGRWTPEQAISWQYKGCGRNPRDPRKEAGT